MLFTYRGMRRNFRKIIQVWSGVKKIKTNHRTNFIQWRHFSDLRNGKLSLEMNTLSHYPQRLVATTTLQTHILTR